MVPLHVARTPLPVDTSMPVDIPQLAATLAGVLADTVA